MEQKRLGVQETCGIRWIERGGKKAKTYEPSPVKRMAFLFCIKRIPGEDAPAWVRADRSGAARQATLSLPRATPPSAAALLRWARGAPCRLPLALPEPALDGGGAAVGRRAGRPGCPPGGPLPGPPRRRVRSCMWGSVLCTAKAPHLCISVTETSSPIPKTRKPRLKDGACATPEEVTPPRVTRGVCGTLRPTLSLAHPSALP